MTEITSEMAREVLWASSEDGVAQLAAAWGTACRLGLDAHGLTRADVGALLWAAHTVSHPEALGDPRMVRMLEMITERGEAGMTIREVAIALYREDGEAIPRATLHDWAEEYHQAGVLTRATPPRPGHWVAVTPS